MAIKGRITRISGPLIIAEGMKGIQMYEMVKVGEEGLIGEVSRIMGDNAYIQVYESTSGLRPGDPVEGTGAPLSLELGPGLLTSIYDGVQRPLNKIAEFTKDIFIRRGVHMDPIPKDRKWTFTPVKLGKGETVSAGDIIGTVQETSLIEHKVMIPPNMHGRIRWIAVEGDYTIEDMIGELEIDGKNIPLKLSHRWPVRLPRPFKEKLEPSEPLITGVRIIDTMFPMAKGGTGAIPGAFGTGKCVSPDTPVLLADGTLTPIEEIFNNYSKTGKIVSSDTNETLIDVSDSNLQVITFDGRKLKTAKVSHLYKGKADKLVKIRTKSGREIKVTPLHKLITIHSNGAFAEKPAGLLKKGDFLALPRKLPITGSIQELADYIPLEATIRDPDALNDFKITVKKLESIHGSLKAVANVIGMHPAALSSVLKGKQYPKVNHYLVLEEAGKTRLASPRLYGYPRSRKTIQIPEYVNEKLAELIGLIISSGMMTLKGIRLFSNNETIIKRGIGLFKEIFGIEPVLKSYRTIKGIGVNSSILVKLFANIGVPIKSKARNAIVPKAILSSPANVLVGFLRGYYLGDGSFGKNGIEFATTSKQLVTGLSYLLSRLGILYTVRKKIFSGIDYYRIIITGMDELQSFYEKLELGTLEGKGLSKVDRLAAYIKSHKPGRISRDALEINSDTIKRVAEQVNHRNIGIKLSNYTVMEEKIGKGKLALLATASKDEVLTTISGALEYVFADEIIDIEVIEGDFTVYDTTIPETHNFVGGTAPALLHNTVTLHSFAQWSAAKVVIYIGCGERGNEMTEVLERFPEYTDPWTGKPLMERTILIANTSNMPVAAREASIYVGITLAEYYRDMGYDTLIVADSTSRWAEALREIAGRLEEMPAEEGYPSYLASRLAEFYERAGRAVATGSPERVGSVTVVGAVSPPGGDFTEPVTSHTKRFIRVFWALDAKLAYSRHYPAINWIDSYSAYADLVAKWWHENVNERWREYREEAMEILLREDELREIVRLVGPESLSEHDKLVLETARLLKDGFLKQNAFDEIDAFSPPEKQFLLLRMIINFHREAKRLVEKGITVSRIKEAIQDAVVDMSKARFTIPNDKPELVEELEKKAIEKLKSLEVTG